MARTARESDGSNFFYAPFQSGKDECIQRFSMVSSPRLESLAQRFAPYIDELRDFFLARKVSFGTPEDLIAFPERLGDPAFADEMASMARSVLYRENEAVPLREITELIAVAVGGAQLDEAEPGLDAPIAAVHAFVLAVTRPPRGDAPLEAISPEPAIPLSPFVKDPQASQAISKAPLQVAELPLAPDPGHATHITAPNTAPSEEAALNGIRSALTTALLPGPAPALPVVATEVPSTDAESHINDRLSRALAHTEDRAEVPHTEPAQAQAAQTEAVPERPSRTVFVPQQGRMRRENKSVGAFLRNAYWIPGLCVLLLAFGVVSYMRNRPTQPAPVQLAPAAAGTHVPSPPKPSPYGATPRRSAHSSEPNVPTPARHTAPDQQLASVEPPSPAPAPSATKAPAATVRRDTTRAVLPARTPSTLLPGAREGVFLASSGVMAAHLLSAPAPGYPKLASFARVEGSVIVQVVVSRTGNVEATRVLEGPHLLRGAAEHAIRRWRYRPYVVDGKPTDVATIVTVSFQLRR